MTDINQAKQKVTARIWQSIAQSGVNVAALPKEELDVLVDAIADGVLLAIDESLDNIGLPARERESTAAPTTGEEQILWEGRPLLSIVTHYEITNERVRIYHGLIAKDVEDIELVRIQDLDITRGVSERLLNIGDIHIRSADPSDPTAVLRNVTNVQDVHEILRRAMLDARKRFRYSVQEEI